VKLKALRVKSGIASTALFSSSPAVEFIATTGDPSMFQGSTLISLLALAAGAVASSVVFKYANPTPNYPTLVTLSNAFEG
jgi:hypothetical protein